MNKDQFIGSILAGVVADALSANYTEKITPKIDEIMTSMITCDGGINKYAANSELIINVIKSIINTKGKTNAKDIALTCANKCSPDRHYNDTLFENIKEHPDKWDCAYKKIYEHGSLDSSSLARIAPIGLMYLSYRDDIGLLDDIKNVLQCSHMNPESFESCYVFCKLMLLLLCIKNINDYNTIIDECIAYKQLIAINDNDELITSLNLVRKLLTEAPEKFDVMTLKNGAKLLTNNTQQSEVITTFVLVLWCFLFHFEYSDEWHPIVLLKHCILIECRNTSVFGNLIGLLYGSSWIREFSQNIEDYDNIKELLNEFYSVIIT